jgi:hypothetical protein
MPLLPGRPSPMSQGQMPQNPMQGQNQRRMDPRALDQQLQQKEQQLQSQLKQVRAIRTLIQAKAGGRQVPGR